MMKEEIVFVTTGTDPEFKIRLAKFPSLDSKYTDRNIIIIPGWLGGVDNFSTMARAMQKYGNTIIYEPRGFGKSITPHKKGYFGIDDYNKELGEVIKYLKLKDKNFCILGSCSGSSQAFTYCLDGNGPKPGVMVIYSPDEFYNTPFFVPVLGWIPTFIMKIIQKVIIVLYRAYLKLRRTGESAAVTWADDRLKKNDDWSLRRFVVEFIVKYDIRGRQEELDIPIQMFVAEKDHFVDPERSQKFLSHKESTIVSVKDTVHRVHEGKEDLFAKDINDFLTKLNM